MVRLILRSTAPMRGRRRLCVARGSSWSIARRAACSLGLDHPGGIQSDFSLTRHVLMYDNECMVIGVPKDITDIRRFFAEPSHPRQRQYEALRAYFVEERPSHEVARAFGYTPGSFRVLCHQFRRDPDPQFFALPLTALAPSRKKSGARLWSVALRKQNHSVYEISQALKEHGTPLSPTAVREVLREEGFAPLPRRGDEERPDRLGPIAEAGGRRARVRATARHAVHHALRGTVPVPARSGAPAARADRLARQAARLQDDPRGHALRCALALKLWSIERKSHVMAFVTDPGLALFCGLNVVPEEELPLRVLLARRARATVALLAAWHRAFAEEQLFERARSTWTSTPCPTTARIPRSSATTCPRAAARQTSVLVFLAQDAERRAFCYSNADLRKGEEAEEIFRFIEFWKKTPRRAAARTWCSIRA